MATLGHQHQKNDGTKAIKHQKKFFFHIHYKKTYLHPKKSTLTSKRARNHLISFGSHRAHLIVHLHSHQDRCDLAKIRGESNNKSKALPVLKLTATKAVGYNQLE